jgi:hypothetical protein
VTFPCTTTPQFVRDSIIQNDVTTVVGIEVNLQCEPTPEFVGALRLRPEPCVCANQIVCKSQSTNYFTQMLYPVVSNMAYIVGVVLPESGIEIMLALGLLAAVLAA